MKIKLFVAIIVLKILNINGMELENSKKEFIEFSELMESVELPTETFIEAYKAATGQVLSLKHIVIKNLEANQINIEDKVPAEVIEFKNKVIEQALQIKYLIKYKNCPKIKNFYLNLINNWQTAKQSFPALWNKLLKYLEQPEYTELQEEQLIADAILFQGIREGNLYLLNFALTLGASVNARGNPSYTGNATLIYAVMCRNKEIVKVLLDKGVNVNAQGRSNRTALIYAAMNRHQDTQMLEILINAGADLNIKDAEEYTALRWAIIGKYTKLIHALIKAGADPNIKGSIGENALFPALRNHLDVDIIQMLIDAGADVNAPNYNGWSPLMFAKYGGYSLSPEVLTVLEQAEKAQETTCCIS